MKIMTGKNGAPHVTSQQFRQLVEGTVGQDSYILASGECLEPELQTNNLLKIRSGMMSHHGNLSVVEIGTYDEVTIQNGKNGMHRIDLIVNLNTKNEETGIESSDWVVIQGTPSSESPAVPEYTEGNLQNGDLVDDCPVFEVHLNGINVTEVKKLLTVAQNISELIGDLKPVSFTLNATSYCQIIAQRCHYTPATGVVHIECAIRGSGSSNIPLNTALFTVPSAYKPKKNEPIPVTTEDLSGYASIDSSGTFRQSASSSQRTLYLSTDYSIN